MAKNDIITIKKGMAINAFMNTQWAINEESLQEVLYLAQNHTYEAFFSFEDRKAEPIIRGDRGIIDIQGVIFRSPNIITMLGMGTALDDVNKQIDVLLNSGIKKIDFTFDTPGGQMQGVNALANRIKSLKGIETTGIAKGECCSAGYWLIASCDTVVAEDETSILGSIGVMLTVSKEDEDDSDSVIIVSSNAPNKNADPKTEEGLAEYQSLVDSLESIFIKSVADNRGVSIDTVKETFGKGGVMIASDALAVGMIDSIITFDGGNMEITVGLLKEDYKAIVDELTVEATSPLKTRITELEAENTDYVTEVAQLTTENQSLKDQVVALTPEDSNLSEGTKQRIAALEKNLIVTSLAGFPQEFKDLMAGLQGTVAVETITKIATAVSSMKNIINDLGGARGEGGTDGDLESLDTKAEKLKAGYIDSGMSEYEAHKKAYRMAAKK